MQDPVAPTPNGVHFTALAFRLANRAVTADIVEGSPAMLEAWPGRGALRCYDTRPMLDQREHSPEVLDMSAEALQYADEVKLIERHPERPYLVRFLAG